MFQVRRGGCWDEDGGHGDTGVGRFKRHLGHTLVRTLDKLNMRREQGRVNDDACTSSLYPGWW